MASTDVTLEELEAAIRNLPDFPQEGIQFKDITPVLGNARLLDGSISHLLGEHTADTVDVVAGIDARGFIFGAAMARELGVGFVPIRKKGKLPWHTHEESYDLEYGSNTIAIHTDAVTNGQRVLLVDDLLATGGTAAAAAKLAPGIVRRVSGVVPPRLARVLVGRDLALLNEDHFVRCARI